MTWNVFCFHALCFALSPPVSKQLAKQLIEKIRFNINKTAKYARGKNPPYQNILLDNVQQLANYIDGKREDMCFNVPLLKIQRNDSIELQRRILAMTPAERKKIGISKSGLWYQKKKLTEGKTLKVYSKVMSKYG